MEVRRNFFSNRTVEDWNKLPSEVKNARTVAIFKDGYTVQRRRWRLTMDITYRMVQEKI